MVGGDLVDLPLTTRPPYPAKPNRASILCHPAPSPSGLSSFHFGPFARRSSTCNSLRLVAAAPSSLCFSAYTLWHALLPARVRACCPPPPLLPPRVGPPLLLLLIQPACQRHFPPEHERPPPSPPLCLLSCPPSLFPTSSHDLDSGLRCLVDGGSPHHNHLPDPLLVAGSYRLFV